MGWAVAAFLAFLAAAPQNEIAEANKALEQQDYVRAAALLEKALEGDPENFRARFNLAFAYAQLERDEEAIEHYEKVVEEQPELAAARLNLGMLLMRASRPAEAAPHFEALSQQKPGDFRAQLLYGRALADSSQPEKAVPAYQEALELDPNSAEAALELGQALARLERFDEAAGAYQQAAQIDPQLSGMLLQLAETLEERGRDEQALSLYQQYLASHTDAIAVQERVGFLLMKLKRYPEAIDVFEQAVDQDPTVANQAALAQAYSLNNNLSQALAAWGKAVSLDAASPDLHLRYANALLHAQSYAEAAKHYLEALKGNAELVDGWNGLAFSLYKMEDYQGALKALAQSAAKGPEKAANVFLRAVIQDTLQMHEEALASYRRFLEMNPGLKDEEWKSRERIKAIQKILEKR